MRIEEEGFSLRFHSLRRESRSFTPLFTHTHRRWGRIGSRGIAADRDRWGEGRRTGFYGINRGDTSTGTETLAKGLVQRATPLATAEQMSPEAACAPSGVLSTLGSSLVCPIGPRNHATQIVMVT